MSERLRGRFSFAPVPQVESLLEQLDQKFEDMSSQILDRSTSTSCAPICALGRLPVNPTNPFLAVTQMSSRVDALEASIQDIINSDAPPPLPPSLPQSPLISQRKSTASG